MQITLGRRSFAIARVQAGTPFFVDPVAGERPKACNFGLLYHWMEAANWLGRGPPAGSAR